MVAPAFVAAIAAGVMMTGFAANEMSHGGLAEGMGMGHQHMLDHGGYHCADPDDAHWDDHVAHMHGEGADHCGDDHMHRSGHEGMGGMGGMDSMGRRP
jgi:hypothetical protein